MNKIKHFAALIFISFCIFSHESKIFNCAAVINVPHEAYNGQIISSEIISSTMLLNFWGYDISIDKFYDKFILKNDWIIGKDYKIHAADPNSAYIGNARVKSGVNHAIGCYLPVLYKAMSKTINPEEHKIINETGKDIDDICKEYTDNNIPALVYCTINTSSTQEPYRWVISFINKDSKFKLGDYCKWQDNRRCLILAGYDDKYYFFNDPYENVGVISIEKMILKKNTIN